jgi:plastocyanin
VIDCNFLLRVKKEIGIQWMLNNIVENLRLKIVIFMFTLNLCVAVDASELHITLLTSDAKPMPNAVVYLMSSEKLAQQEIDRTAIMDQIDRQFLPHILVVQKDTQIRFPNSDSIKHHVYSFSQAKVFELQLYKGLDAEPLLFSKTGVVELGCNVHDWMLGYILVVDSPYFGKTNSSGEMTLSVPNGDYQLQIWHPRIVQTAESLRQNINMTGDTTLLLNLSQPLLPDVNQYEVEKGDFSEYE